MPCHGAIACMRAESRWAACADVENSLKHDKAQENEFQYKPLFNFFSIQCATK